LVVALVVMNEPRSAMVGVRCTVYATKKEKAHLFDLRMKVLQEIDPFT
jgi:hypothetical protein